MKQSMPAVLALCGAGLIVTNFVLVRAKVAGLLFEYRPADTHCRVPLGVEVRWCTANAAADELAACHLNEETREVVCGAVEKHLWCVCALGYGP